MTDEDDVLSVVEQTERIRPHEIRNELMLWKNYNGYGSRSLDSMVSRALRNLLRKKDVRIARNVPGREKVYVVTRKGKKRAVSNIREGQPQAISQLEIPEILKPSFHAKGNMKFAKTIIDDITPKGKAELDVFFRLDEKTCRHSPKLLEAFQSQMNGAMRVLIENFASRFFKALKEASIDAKDSRYRWRDWEESPLEIGKVVKQEQASLDFDALIALRFNGRKAVDLTDWQAEIESHKDQERTMNESWKNFKQEISRPGLSQQNWAKENFIVNAQEGELRTSKFLVERLAANQSEIEQIASDPWSVVNTPEKLREWIVQKLVSKAVITIEHDEEGSPIDVCLDEQGVVKSEQNIGQALDELLREEAIEIIQVPIYQLRIKDKKKANDLLWKARSGYPSPTAFIQADDVKLI